MGISKFLNSPFGIWLLSSVGIALLVNFISEENKCFATAQSLLPVILKGPSELDLRMLEVGNIIHSDKPKLEVQKSLRAIKFGDTYFYSEFKGKSLMDVHFDIFLAVARTGELGIENKDGPWSISPNQRDAFDFVDKALIDDKYIDELRSSFPDDKLVELRKELSTFPYATTKATEALDNLGQTTACRPANVMRLRITQYLHGL